MHGARGFALRGDDRILIDIEPLADLGQLVGMVGVTQRLGEPVAQGLRFTSRAHVGRNDRLLARLKRPIEI